MRTLEKAAVLLAALLELAACGNPPAGTAASTAPAPAPSPPAMAPPSAAPASLPVAPEMEAIRAAGASKDDASSAGNADAMASVYEEEAIILPPSWPAAKGTGQIRKFLKTYLAQLAGGGYTPAVARAVEIGVSGNIGFRSGTYLIKNASGDTMDSGKWLEIWSKSGGEWRISKDIWNSDSLPLIVPPDEKDDAAR